MPKKRNPRDRFNEKVVVDLETGCWEWAASCTDKGYGMFRDGNYKYGLAHVYAYKEISGSVPMGLELDHLCRNTRCVNPAHLEAVTHQVNCQRGKIGEHWRNKTHCPMGHPYSLENTRYDSGSRRCRECGRIQWRKSYPNTKRYLQRHPEEEQRNAEI